jgi:hypothetical protein
MISLLACQAPELAAEIITVQLFGGVLQMQRFYFPDILFRKP